jgi:hypothetical protein
MAADVYATVRRFGFSINVRTEYDQKTDRYAFLMCISEPSVAKVTSKSTFIPSNYLFK